MKYRIRKTKEIVDVVGYSACTHTRCSTTDYVCYIDNGGNEVIGRGLNLIWDFEPINEESVNDFDLQSFRAEAAKDILCHLLDRYTGDSDNKGFVTQAIGIADELIKQLKENVMEDKAFAWLEKQGELQNKLIDYRNYLIYQTEHWSKKEHDKTNSKIGTQDCIGHANAFISARAKFEEMFDYDSWNEKQGEQKSTDKVELKFKIGDWVVNKQDEIARINQVKKDSYGTQRYYIEFTNGVKTDPMPCFVNEEFHLWTIQDAKDGDVLAYVTDEEDLWIMIYRSLYEPYEGHVHYHALLVNDNFSDKGTCCISVEDLNPATKEQHDLLFQKMKDAGYEWDAEKKELKKIEQNPAWSKEDEKMMNGVLNHLREYYVGKKGYPYVAKPDSPEMMERSWLNSIKDMVQPQPKQEWNEEDEEMFDAVIADIQFTQKAHNYEANQVVYEKEIDWFKSLKERYTWRPSEEQIKELNKTIELSNFGIDQNRRKILESLYNYLKKLLITTLKGK